MEALILTVILTSVPLIFAATGELVAERSGVLNLGVEGMMLMGAVSAFAATSILGNPYMGILAGAVAGALTAAVFSLFALGLATNQVATGLALTILGQACQGLLARPLLAARLRVCLILPFRFLLIFRLLAICCLTTTSWLIYLLAFLCLWRGF